MTTSMATITPHVRAIDAPEALRNLEAWLIWRFEAQEDPTAKPRKVPYYADGARRYGAQGTREDVARLVTFEAAKRAAARRGFDGVGFAPRAELDVCALDFDNCILPNGRVMPEVLNVLDSSYAELSPSGKGIRAFFKGQLGNLKAHGEPFGMELFSTKGYVTFTGNVLEECELVGNENTVAPIPQTVRALVQQRFKRQLEEVQANAGYAEPPVGLSDRDIQRCLDALPENLDYDTWVMTGMAIHHETRGEGFDLWDEWSQRSPKYTTRDYGIERWNSFGKGQGTAVTIRSLVHLANAHDAGIEVGGVAGPDEFADVEPPLVGIARFNLIPAAVFAAGDPPKWIVHSVLPQAELAVVYGESGSGKSFFMLDLVAAVARGVPWRGHRVCQGRVVYVAAEGAGGFRKRLVAYSQHHQVPLESLQVYVIPDALDLLHPRDFKALAEAIGKADVVVIDTLAATTPGANENAAEDMGKALAHCKGIHAMTGALIVLVHHSGKDAARGARGWSGIRAAVDAEIEISRQGDVRAARITKQKDGEDGGQPLGFKLVPIVVGVGADGVEVTSCAVEAECYSMRPTSRRLGRVQRLVLDTIEGAASFDGFVAVDDVLSSTASKLTTDPDKRDRRREHVRRAIDDLADAGLIQIEANTIRLPHAPSAPFEANEA